MAESFRIFKEDLVQHRKSTNWKNKYCDISDKKGSLMQTLKEKLTIKAFGKARKIFFQGLTSD